MMMNEPNASGRMRAVVLAAGAGGRLGELTEHTAKPLVRLGGVPVIERTLRWLSSHGVREVAINLHHLGQQIEAHVGDGSRFGLGVNYSRESELRGTAGALVPLRDWLSSGPFLVVAGDNYYDFDLAALMSAHADNAGVATMALYTLDAHQHTCPDGRFVEIDRTHRVLRLVDGERDPQLRVVSASCYVLEPGLLKHIPTDRPSSIADLFVKVLRAQGILCGHMIDGRCLCLDTPDALALARRYFGEGVTGDVT